MKRRIRLAMLVGYLAAGGFLTQAGIICNSVGTAGVASSGALVDDGGNFLGIPFVHVCGQENILIVDPITGETIDLLNAEDDLMFGCPARIVEQGG